MPAAPGMLNYIEGNVSLDGDALRPQEAGSVIVESGEILRTGRGKAELLLTPGSFLRVGEDSEVKLSAAGPDNATLEILKGRVMIEVAFFPKGSQISVSIAGSTVNLMETGTYSFDARQELVSVYEGKARVRLGERKVDIRGARVWSIGTSTTSRLNMKDVRSQDPLYLWSALRSKELAEATGRAAQAVLRKKLGWFGAGWYWDSAGNLYVFMPGDGVLKSPFGFEYVSPWEEYAPRRPLFA